VKKARAKGPGERAVRDRLKRLDAMRKAREDLPARGISPIRPPTRSEYEIARLKEDAAVFELAVQRVKQFDAARERGVKGGVAKRKYTPDVKAVWLRLARDLRRKNPSLSVRQIAKRVAAKTRLSEKSEGSIRVHLALVLDK
jgi:hypothetical protein